MRGRGLAAALDAVAGEVALAGAGHGPVGVCGVGIDAVDLERFRAVLARRRGMADRLFTDAERSYADRAADPVPRLATRFAAKEAVLKALGAGLGAFRFAEVGVIRRGLDAPFLVLDGSAARLAERAGVTRWHLSLTHTELVAVAVVIAVGGGGAVDRPPAP